MPGKWMKYILLLIAVLLAACIAYAGKTGSGDSEPSQGKPVRSKNAMPALPQMKSKVVVGTVGESLDVEVRRYTGHIVSSSSVNLVSRVSGELLRVLFKEGESVRKGDLLYALDDIRYDAALKNAKAKVGECEAKLAYAEVSYTRSDNLYQQNAASKDSLENTQSEYEAALSMLEAAEANLITARDDLDNTLVYAPIDGKIGVTNFTEGNYITPNSGTLATIVQMDPLRVSFSLSNRDFLSLFRTEKTLKEEAHIRLRLADDSMYELPGVVELVDNQANRQSDTIQVYAKFDNPEGMLIPGSTVTVLLSRSSGRMLPSIPPSAVMHDAQSAYVYVLMEGEVVERRDITPGVADGAQQIVRTGLEPGEQIVVDGMHKVMPGTTVIPVTKG